MSRLKTALEEIKTLNKTVATLTQTNKQLVEAIAAMGGKQPEQKSAAALVPENAHTATTFTKCRLRSTASS